MIAQANNLHAQGDQAYDAGDLEVAQRQWREGAQLG